MKIQILSDLHREFFEKPIIPYINPEAELILLAGDIVTDPYEYHVFLTELRTITKASIVAVLGNHEYYGNNIQFALKEYAAACLRIPDFQFLENKFVDFGKIRVIGATLWTDYDNGLDTIAAIQGMSDFRAIEYEEKSSSIDLLNAIVKKHKKSVSFIDSTLEKSNDRVNVVLTHHMPSFNLVHAKYRGSRLNSSFASNLDNLIMENSPDLWVFGHTHSHIDAIIGNTRVIANPLGYSKEYYSSGFVDNLIVEL